MTDTSTEAVERPRNRLAEQLRNLASTSNDGDLRGPAFQAAVRIESLTAEVDTLEAERDALRAEVERLRAVVQSVADMDRHPTELIALARTALAKTEAE